jgi:hypothetical protein
VSLFLQIIPALERVLSLVGADVRSWFYHMKKPTRLLPQKRPTTALALPSPTAQQPAAAAVGPTAGLGLVRMVGGNAFAAAAVAAAAGAGGGGVGPVAGEAAGAEGNAAAAAAGGGGGGGGFGLAAALTEGEGSRAAAAAAGVYHHSNPHWSPAGPVGAAAGLLPGYLAPAAAGAAGAGGSATIDTYYLSRHCAVCDDLTRAGEPLCERCRSTPQVSGVVLAARAARLERQHQQLIRLCQSCGGGGGWDARHGGVVCTSLDCGLYYERFKVLGELRSMAALAASGLGML